MSDSNRDDNGRFPKGQSGNPGGRRPMSQECREILEAALPDVCRKIVELTDHPDPKISLTACNLILDRILGRPAQQINADIKTGSISDAHLAALKDIQARRDHMLQIDAEPTKN